MCLCLCLLLISVFFMRSLVSMACVCVYFFLLFHLFVMVIECRRFLANKHRFAHFIYINQFRIMYLEMANRAKAKKSISAHSILFILQISRSYRFFLHICGQIDFSEFRSSFESDALSKCIVYDDRNERQILLQSIFFFSLDPTILLVIQCVFLLLSTNSKMQYQITEIHLKKLRLFYNTHFVMTLIHSTFSNIVNI